MAKKYNDSKAEARFLVNHKDFLPHEMKSDEPSKLARVLRRFFRKNNYNGVGIAEDNDSVWLWRHRK